MSIRIDASDHAAVAVCRHAGCNWRALRPDRTSAHAAASDHEKRSHPLSRQARNAADGFAARKARKVGS